VRVPVGGTLSVPLPVGGSLCDHALMSEDEETTRVGMTSRRLLMAQGLVMTSATLLAACGSGSASSTTTPAPANPSEQLEDAEVNLLLNPNVPNLVTGTVARLKTNAAGSLYGTVPGQPSSIKGTFGGLALSALLSQQDQVPSGTGLLTTTKLSGSVGPAVSSLLGQFTLDTGALFKQGTITGTTQGMNVAATATPNSTFGSTNAADLSGNFGGVPFALVANLPLGGRGTVRGTVSLKSIRLDVHPTNERGDFSIIRLTGTYSGPTDLLAIIVGTIAYFAA
jgi:hypothetical protein